MAKAVSNTSPFLYLYRIGVEEWLSKFFNEVWIPDAVVTELQEGRQRGYDVPDPLKYNWIRVFAPHTVPSEWLTLELGRGELETMALALENPKHTVLLDDALARRIAQAADLEVWGTLRVLLEAKKRKFVDKIEPLVDQLRASGMWISGDLRDRVLVLATEKSRE
ncbi:MAG: DUF3368 domain-containing protein [Deltaproteobacteria bacterium]|nr:DUF3368 domain-containing protein [Deltaproteobacteria bacterium]